ncbi:C-C motif chemokine 4-like, partial [Myotis lucifugus]|uniref:C-C motif chemokine 4-like n=1 Tax=Myotis lucifugus TaxID=59463 RepID=UPI0003C4C434
HHPGEEKQCRASHSQESLFSAKTTKLCVAVLSLLVLVAAFCSPALSAPMGSDPPTACCFTYIPWKIPCNFVMDYYKTSSLCSQPTMIFQTKKSRHACANPSEAWVQDYMNDLELN